MIKNYFKFSFVVLLLIGTGCKVTQIPKFTSSDNLLKLEMNSSIDDAIKVLGCNPYNILSSQIDGHTIYLYKYKRAERTLPTKSVNLVGQGEIMGIPKYNGKMQDLLLFYKDGKLVSFITTKGKKDSHTSIKLSNTIYLVSKHKGEYHFEVKNSNSDGETSSISDETSEETVVKKKKIFGLF